MYNERLCTLRMEGKIFNTTLINVHAPTVGKDGFKDEFYAKLTVIYDCQPGHDIKILLGALNAKTGREEAHQSAAGKETLHELCNINGWRLVDFATMEDMKVISIYLQRKNTHKETWLSPVGTTSNQTDHVLIQARHRSTLLDVRSCREADSHSDHYMIKIRSRQRKTSKNKKSGGKRIKYNTEKLKEEGTKETYQETISQMLDNNERREHTSIDDDWKALKETISDVAESVLGKTTRQEKKPGMTMNAEE
jgi:hypothetical protein